MQIFKNLSDYSSKTPLALSIGMFDGVHLGHQNIISKITKVSENKGFEPSVLSFWPHPRLVFNPNENLKLLNTLDEKTALLEKFGVEKLFLQNFDEAFRNLSGEDFVKKILVERLNVKYLLVGHDHVFGKNRSGNFDLLQKLAPELGFEVEKLQAVDYEGRTVSSTKIRALLSEGKIIEANEMLGYHFPVSGKVVHGKKIGRTIGFPTANIETDSVKILPKKGAYIVEVSVKNKLYKGMLSIGTNPTVGGEKLTVEVYILNFSGDIYGEEITVKFRDFLHEEIKFEGLEKLVERLEDDKIRTENFQF